MMHTDRSGGSKILKKCTLPITGVNCVKKIVTNLAVLKVTNEGIKLIECAPGVSVEEVIQSTDVELIIPKKVLEMKF